MRSKRDQVQAHTFMMGRLTSGMLLADPDAPESPLGRTSRGALVGLIVGVLVCGGALVYGLLRPGGNDAWRSGDTLIVNKDTGARYLYADGRLRPVRNYASAVLIGGADLKTTSVGSASLAGTPVGRPVGITGAPDSVPSTGELESSPWQVCSTGSGAQTTLVPGAPVETASVGAKSALVVKGPDKHTYLVWQGSRLELDEDSGAAESLGYASVTPRPVSAAFLDALVTGPDLATPKVEGRGTAGPELGGRATRIGQVFRVVAGSGNQEYLLQKDGLLPVTDTQSALLLGDPDTRTEAYDGGAPNVVTIDVSDLRAHQAPGSAGTDPSVAGLPDSPPSALALAAGESVCAQVDPADGQVRVTSVRVAESALSPAAQADPTALTAACVPVDRVVARPGHGTLARALGAAGETVGDTTFLIGDDGVKYRIPDANALAALGYDGATPVKVPSTLLAMLPTGPELSARAAASDSGGAAQAPGAAAQCGTGGSGSGGSGGSVPGGTGSGPAAIAGRAPVGGSAGAPQSSVNPNSLSASAN
ncbi:type VII secretion protein EccB [Streptomyces sp. MBT53]|uniref:type VII secretion protein EccB n=1 Tax=Streptomyces sp. MBT53 TaxID=1488384 RepID=UPI00191273FE|nr:type VII secretion protein EccB [Streptomyces sp. MBT53]MBK6018619.1 type VII secretion protein EccB [Streptomyces sp. MBT53]